jgi:hypothetical protein
MHFRHAIIAIGIFVAWATPTLGNTIFLQAPSSMDQVLAAAAANPGADIVACYGTRKIPFGLALSGTLSGAQANTQSFSDGPMLVIAGGNFESCGQWFGPGQFSIAVTSDNCAGRSAGNALLVFGLRIGLASVNLSTACSGASDLFLRNHAYAEIFDSNVTFAQANGGEQIHVETGSIFEAPQIYSYTISEGGRSHWGIYNGGSVLLDGGAVDCQGNPSFSGAFLYEQLGGIFQALNGTAFNCNAATAAFKTQMWGNAVADFDGVSANPLPGTSEPAYPILGAGAICNQSAYC